jgi:hypothetical protein
MRLRLTLLAFLVFSCAFATEIPITEKPKIVNEGEYAQAIASDSATYLVLTAGLFNFNRYGDYNFLGTIVNADGTLLTPAGFWISDMIGDNAKVIGGSGQYLVIINSRSGALGVRVSSRGEVLDTTPFLITPTPVGWRTPNPIYAAWDGTAYFLEWSTSSNSAAYAYIGKDGPMQASGTIAQSEFRDATAARNGTSLIVWSNADGVFVRSVTRVGISDPIRLSTINNTGVAVVAGGDEFLAMWSENGVEVAQRLDDGGRPIAAPIPLPILSHQSPVAASWDGSSYVVVWSDENGVHAVRLTQGMAGKTIDVETGSDLYQAGAASADGRTEVLISEPASKAAIKSIDSSNTVSPPPSERGAYTIAAIVPSVNVHAVFNGIDYVVVREDGKIKFSRITRDGRHLDGDGVVVSNGVLLDVAEGSGITLVLWNEYLSQTSVVFRAARIDPSGTVLDNPPLQLDSSQAFKARAIWDGSQFVVFWAPVALTSMPLRGTLAVRIGLNGNIVDSPPRQIFPTSLYFDVAKNKDRYQVVYGGEKVLVFAVTSDLQLATGSGTLTLPTEKGKSFSIASNGDDFLVVWNNEAEEIVGQHTGWNADSIGPRVVYSDNKSRKGKPHVTFDGSGYVVVWPEADNAKFEFRMRNVDRDMAEVAGPIMTIASGPIIGGGEYLPFLTDWGYVPGPIPAVVYGRTDQVDGLLWYERWFLQEASSNRHRVSRR